MNITDPQTIEDVCFLIDCSTLDQTLKDILIRDIKANGIDDFTREQVLAYCDKVEKQLDERVKRAQSALGAEENKQ
ncbi:MAG TPA: hypothetical protein VEA59_06845 [Patescibacteria group bacterium]|nr:hypothetical protein [Patescibacteria group bacterium]